MPAIIQVNNLSKQFKEIKAVDDLSFTVEEGDVYGFLGQNGAGKSTTIRMLLTLIKPTAGDISIFGKNLYTHRKEILKQVGAIIEKPDLYKYLSAYDNLAIFAKMSGIETDQNFTDGSVENGWTGRKGNQQSAYFQPGYETTSGYCSCIGT